jgi:CBS domain-containing protein
METVADVIRRKGHGVYSVRRDASMEEAVNAFLDKDVNALLVMDGHTVLGLFTKNELLRSFLKQPDQFRNMTAGECASQDFFSTTPQTGLADLFAEMMHRGVHNVPVMDGDRPIAMITSLDVVLEQKQSVTFENEQLMRYIHGRHYE